MCRYCGTVLDAIENRNYISRLTYVTFFLLLLIIRYPLNAELNPICHLLALLGGATIVVVSRLRVKV